jgi:hypothetical protein
MFDFFQNKQEAPTDAKSIRHHLLVFIKDQLKRSEGGEGGAIRNMQLIMSPSTEDRHLYEGAVFLDDPSRFKDEVQKIADDYAIDLPEGWTMTTLFEDDLPPEAIKAEHLPVALFISARKKSLGQKNLTAVIKVLRGEAEKAEYLITSGSKNVCIGRDKNAHTEDGFMRVNTIAFPSDDKDNSNKFVSRQHAHIEWSEIEGGFYLYADEGGVPPRNKVKVRTAAGTIIKLQTTEIGHHLQEGDQIMLGDSALLGFYYQNEEGEMINE